MSNKNEKQLLHPASWLCLGLFIAFLVQHCIGNNRQERAIATIDEQRATINNLQSNIDSISSELRFSIIQTESILDGLSTTTELAERSDIIIAGLRTAMGEHGTTVRQITERQQRINGLVVSLISEHETFKARVREIVQENRYNACSDGYANSAKP